MDPQTLQKLQEWENDISDRSNRRKLLAPADWADSVPSLGGVYVVWDDTSSNAVYVGETCHLRHRLKDMARPHRHGFRRKIRIRLGMQLSDDLLLSKALAEHYSYSYLVLPLGRIEFEEYLIFRWHTTVLNKKPERFKYRHDFEDWRNLHQ